MQINKYINKQRKEENVFRSDCSVRLITTRLSIWFNVQLSFMLITQKPPDMLLKNEPSVTLLSHFVVLLLFCY